MIQILLVSSYLSELTGYDSKYYKTFYGASVRKVFKILQDEVFHYEVGETCNPVVI